MKKVKIHFMCEYEYTEDYEIDDDDYEELIGGDWDMGDVISATDVLGDAEEYGNGKTKCEIYDKNGKMIWNEENEQ